MHTIWSSGNLPRKTWGLHDHHVVCKDETRHDVQNLEVFPPVFANTFVRVVYVDVVILIVNEIVGCRDVKTLLFDCRDEVIQLFFIQAGIVQGSGTPAVLAG